MYNNPSSQQPFDHQPPENKPGVASEIKKPAPQNTVQEKALYTRFYDNIYAAMTVSGIDYDAIAERAGLPQRRLRECLIFRLGTGEIRQLFGAMPGICYVCKDSLFNPQSQEPLCLSCLQRVDMVLHQQQEKADQTPSDNIPNASDLPMITETLYNTLLSRFQRLNDVVQRFSEQYPDLAEAVKLECLSEEVTHSQLSSDVERETLTDDEDDHPQSGNEVLDILNNNHDQFDDVFELLDAYALNLEQQALPTGVLSGRDAIRHFGFKRLKRASLNHRNEHKPNR